MQVLILLLIAVVCVLADDKYTTKYDNIDLDTILASDRLLKNYANCILDKGNCTPDGKELKGEDFLSILLIITLIIAFHLVCLDRTK